MQTYEALKIRIYTTEGRSFEGAAIYKTASQKLIHCGATGVSVFRGIYGIGRCGEHGISIADIAEELPIVVEAVSKKEIIEKFVAENADTLKLCTVCIEPTSILKIG